MISYLHVHFQSFTAKHLGGVIHLLDKCQDDSADTNSRSDDSGRRGDLDLFNSVTTFRPNLRNYIKQIRKQNKDKYKVCGNYSVKLKYFIDEYICRMRMISPCYGLCWESETNGLRAPSATTTATATTTIVQQQRRPVSALQSQKRTIWKSA